MSTPTLLNGGWYGWQRSGGKSAIFCLHVFEYILLQTIQFRLIDFSIGLALTTQNLFRIWLRTHSVPTCELPWCSSQISWLTRWPLGSMMGFLDWSDIKACLSLPLITSMSFSSLGHSFTKWLDFLTWPWRRISAISVLKHTAWTCRKITCSAWLNSETVRGYVLIDLLWRKSRNRRSQPTAFLTL